MEEKKREMGEDTSQNKVYMILLIYKIKTLAITIYVKKKSEQIHFEKEF